MKKWLYGIISLIMLGSGIAVAMPNDFVVPCEDGNVEVTAPKQETPNQDNSNSQNDDNSNSSSESDDDNSNDDNSGDNSSDEPSQEPEESEGITEYEFKSYEDYFIDNDVSNEAITSGDLSGNGTATDPYVVHSSNGFWYLSTLKLDKKYIELNCDVVLNDETFDKDGNPSGGDGVVYSWQPIQTGANLNMDGNNHKIKGLYINNPQKGYNIGLFGYVDIKRVENLNLTDVYINASATSIYAISGKVYNLENCTVSGNIKNQNGYALGMAVYVLNARSCKNYADIYNDGRYSAGIGLNIYDGGKIENCCNYGNIYSTNDFARIGGIFVGNVGDSDCEISNCVNYGDLTAKGQQVGGILNCVANGNVYIKNCVNYGDISALYYYGNIVGYTLNTNLVIDSCKTYGTLFRNSSSKCEIIGAVLNSANVKIKNCEVYSQSGTPLLKIENSKNNVEISNCKVQVLGGDTNYFIIQGTNLNSACEITDIEISSELNFNRLYVANEIGALALKNVLINFNGKVTNTPKITNKHNDLKVYSMIYKSENNKFFYGSDFNDFYYSNKQGKIGLSTIDSLGGFQTPVSESLLIDKGYKKIVI